MASLGNLKRLDVAEIRQIWPREQDHLSPWIAENIEALNEELNLQIEIEGREEYIHGFRLDLAGTDASLQVPVIIENQFGRSDHDHLGKLITYSAAKEAGIVLWIANDIHLAHREAIDWLNQITPHDMIFYGVELEVLRIGDSLPAPNFRVVAGPPPSKRPPPVSAVSPRNQKYGDFFEQLRAKLLAVQPGFTRAKARPQSWWTLAVGRTGFSLMGWFTIDEKFRVTMYIDTGSKEQNIVAFDQLKENSAAIEHGVGQELVWDALPEKRASIAYVAVDATIDDDEKRLAEIIEWAVPTMVTFRNVFGPYLKNVELGH